MFCLSCKYIPESPIKDCIDSICKFHPREKILVSDSLSDTTDYIKQFSEYSNVEFHLGNTSRQIGSLWESYKRYPEEPYYVFIQDTLILKKDLNDYLNSHSECISFMYFPETVEHTNTPQYKFYEKIFSKVDYEIPKPNDRIYGCFGPLIILKNSIMKKFEKKGLVEHLITTTRLEHEMAERILGICCSQEGYSLKENNIEGNYLDKYNEIVSNKIETFNKKFLMSKGLRLN